MRKTFKNNLHLKNSLSNLIIIGIITVIIWFCYLFSYQAQTSDKFNGKIIQVLSLISFQMIIVIIFSNILISKKYSKRIIFNILMLALWMISLALFEFMDLSLFILVNNAIWSLFCVFVIFILLIKFQNIKNTIFVFPLMALPYISTPFETMENGYIYFSIVFIVVSMLSIVMSFGLLKQISDMGVDEIKTSIYSYKRWSPYVLLGIVFMINMFIQVMTATNISKLFYINSSTLFISIGGSVSIFFLAALTKFKILNSKIFEITTSILMMTTIGIIVFFLNSSEFLNRLIDLFPLIILIITYALSHISSGNSNWFNKLTYFMFMLAITIMIASQFVSMYIAVSHNFNIFAQKYLSMDLFLILIFVFCLGLVLISNIIVIVKSNLNIRKIMEKDKNNE